MNLEEMLQAEFPREHRQLGEAVAQFRRDEARLLRPGSTIRIYADDEHQRRVDALLADYDRVGEQVTEAANQALAQAETALAKLDGADPLDRLTESEQVTASNRAAFVREDVEAQDYPTLTRRLRAALAANDRVTLYLMGRYGAVRLSHGGGSSPDSLAFLQAIDASKERLSDPQAAEKKSKAHQRIEAAKALRFQADERRRQIDGRHEQMLAGMRQRYAPL